MKIPALRGVLGPNSSAVPQAMRELSSLENSSTEVIVKSSKPANVELSLAQISSAVTNHATNDKDSNTGLDKPQMRASREDLSQKVPTVKESQNKRDVAEQTFEKPQVGHDEVVAAALSPQVVLSFIEMNRAISKEKVVIDSRERLPKSLVEGKAEPPARLLIRQPGGPTPFYGRQRFQDPPGAAAHSSVEAEIGRIAKKDLGDMRIHGDTPSNDEASEQTSLNEECWTSYGSEGEMEFAGIYRDHSANLASSDTFEPMFMNDVVAQLVGAYLENLDVCHAAGQRQCATGRSSVSQDQSNIVVGKNPTILGKRGSKSKRARGEEPDESANLQVSQKRIKKDHQSQGKKLFACPYWKYDKRRYSEHNMSEKHYRHCSSTYGLTIHRIKQHLYRVHKRPDFYCSRCFTVLESRELFDEHSRASLPCSISICPFEEKMTHDQMATIRKRAATGDQVTTWYTIYETLFPSSSKPDSPYAEEISPESVEDFGQWFIGQELVLRDIFTARVARDLPLLPQEERNILDTVLEECLLELARLRGRDFHSPPAEAGPFTWRPLEMQATTAYEAAQELVLRDGSKDCSEPESEEGCPAASSSHSQQESMAEGDVQEFCMASSPALVPQDSLQEEQDLLWDAFVTEDWAMLDSSLNIVDTFSGFMENMGHDLDLSVMPTQDEGRNRDGDEQSDIGIEVKTCAAKHKGKGKARAHDQ